MQDPQWITGNLGQDPEFKTTKTGKTIATFGVASKQKKDGDTMWFNCQLWEQTAEKARKLKTGLRVMVKGIHTENKVGEKTYRNFNVYEIGVVPQTPKAEAPTQPQQPQPPDVDLPF